MRMERLRVQGAALHRPPRPDEVQGAPGDPVSAAFGVLEYLLGAAGIAMGHLGAVTHLVQGLSKLDSRAVENSPHALLERAAVLESVDMRRAIALYQQVALNHPRTRAANEANRNVRTLRAAHPELENVPAA